MKKRIFWALVASVTACVAHAATVTPEMAKAAANVWAARNAQFDTGNGATNVVTVCDTNAAQTVLWHQVSMSGGGSVIIAPVTEIEPVVAALDNDPGELPQAHPLRGILTADMRRRLRFLQLYTEDGSRTRLLGASGDGDEESAEKAAVRKEWAAQQQTKWDKLIPSETGGRARLLSLSESEGAEDEDMNIKVIVPGFEKGGPLTHWNQSNGGGGHCYNYYTPNNCVCGCVATAAGAMMQFFKVGADKEIEADQQNGACTYNGAAYPSSTKGGKYDWSLFDSCTSLSDYSHLSGDQRELLGRVAYDAGVGVGMQWADGASGALEQDIATAYKNFFGFHEVRCVNNPTQDQYAKLIYAQNRAGAPVGLGIEAHSVVAVGYGVDSDGVERVRVFLGWGGSGDAWYALPYINTASTMGGSTYLSTVVDCVITMIGYDNDKVVPVCGQLIPTVNAEVTIDDTVVTANENGLFGARVSAGETEGGQVQISCQGKTGSVTIGSDPGYDAETYESSGGGICNWVPDPILFPLLNSEVALSFADAQEKCVESISTDNPKPVLAFSGTWGAIATDAAWDYLYSMDQENTGDFTNKYIVLCTPYSLSGNTESDGNPSVGVFDGRYISVDPGKMWSFYNGRLSYWSIGSSVYTNDETLVESSATNIVNEGELATYITGEGITNAVIEVMQTGRTMFLIGVSGISLTVTSNMGEFGDVTPAYGYHENTISNGETVVATAFEFVTNSAGNVEFACTGWELTCTNSDDVVSGTGTTAEFTPVPNGAYTLTWLWETNAVKITTKVTSNQGGSGVVDPGTGWFEFGEVVTFTARPSDPSPENPVTKKVHYFSSWGITGLGVLNEESEYEEVGHMFSFYATQPAEITAEFRGKAYDKTGKIDLTVSNYGTDDPNVPPTVFNGPLPSDVIPYDTPTNVYSVNMTLALTDGSFTDTSGNDKQCIGWMLSNDEGPLKVVWANVFPEGVYTVFGVVWTNDVEGGIYTIENGKVVETDTPISYLFFDPSSYVTNGASLKLSWLWELPEESDVTNEFEIVWNDDLNNLSEGYTTNLLTAAELLSAGWGVNDLTVTAPTGWVATVSLDADGNAIATLARDETALAAAMETCTLTVYSNGDDTLTVDATITGGLRGFWYVLYGSDDLTTWEAVTMGSYESGTAYAQAQGTAKDPVAEVNLSIVVTPGDTAAGVKRFYKVVSGATLDPLSE